MFEYIIGLEVIGEFSVCKSGPDGSTTRRGAQYAGDPARGKDGLLWETALPCGGRRERCDDGKRAETSMVGMQSGGWAYLYGSLRNRERGLEMWRTSR